MRGALSANIGAGLLSSVVMLCYALSYAALIFSGDLSAYLHSGVLVTLMCCVVVAPVIALSSSIRFSIGGPLIVWMVLPLMAIMLLSER